MKKIELLAPAGSIESLNAAVQSGTNAVYLGGSKFSARAYASNFDEENMINTVDYCHLYGVKVYITINTLIKESEIEEALEYVRFLYTIGVDAVIVQDTGLAFLIRENFPDLEIHASTQMTAHNGEGALLLKNLGFKRIVLSRELSLEEITHISKDLGVETEIFVHGALCICYSGQCLMSSMIGGRSGNRGRCAQPCRLPYTLIDKLTGRETSAYLLSPKDICTLEDMEKIIASSTASLKIEGRMKRPEYVAGVVDVYRRAIDSVYEGKGFDFEKENKKLLQLFNREGFSKAYLHGNKGRDMMAYNFPKNTGIMLGKALKNSLVELQEDVSIGDGIRIDNEGFTLSKILKEGKEVQEARKGEKVKLMPSKYGIGDLLYKTSDIKLLSELEGYYKNKYEKKIDIPLTATVRLNEALILKTIYDNKEFVFYGDKVQEAIKKPLEKEKLAEYLNKSGDTPFRFETVQFDEFEAGFLPVSSVNSARRGLIEELEKHIINSSKREFSKAINYDVKENKKRLLPEALVLVSNTEQLKAFADSGINGALAVDMFKKQNPISIDEVKALEVENIYLRIPNIIKNEFEHICSIIDKNLEHIKGIVTSNIGIMHRFKGKIKIIGDYKLNIFNSYALNFYEDYIDGVSVSVELNKKEIGEIAAKNKGLSLNMKVYGKEELMVSECCPIGSAFGGKAANCSCSENCSKGSYVLKDRKNEQFVLRTDKFCRSYIYNSAATNLIPFVEEISRIGINSFRLDFIDEDYGETMRILNAFKVYKWPYEYVNFTRGHYKRGVE